MREPCINLQSEAPRQQDRPSHASANHETPRAEQHRDVNAPNEATYKVGEIRGRAEVHVRYECLTKKGLEESSPTREVHSGKKQILIIIARTQDTPTTP